MYKIFIAGKQDLFLQQSSTAQKAQLIPKNFIYLEHSGVTIKGLKIWGSPITLGVQQMAFTLKYEDIITALWNSVPNDTDIFITYMPSKIRSGNFFLGAEEVLNLVNKMRPQVHCFCNVQEWFRVMETRNQTTFINAASLYKVSKAEGNKYGNSELNRSGGGDRFEAAGGVIYCGS